MKKLIFYIMLQTGAMVSFAQYRAEFIVHAPVLAHDDTLQLHLQDDRIGEPHLTRYRSISAGNSNGVYRFLIDSLNHHTWVGMNLSYQKRGNYSYLNIIDEFLLMEGDSIHIYLEPKKGVFYPDEEGYDGVIPILRENWQARFEGRGAPRYELQWRINSLSNQMRKGEMIKTINSDYPTNKFLLLYKLEAEGLDIVEQYKDKLSPFVYNILQKQVRGKFGFDISRILEVSYFYFKPKDEEVEAFQIELEKLQDRGNKDLEEADENTVQSPRYMDYLSKYMQVAFRNDVPNKGGDLYTYYKYVNQKLKPSLLRDRLQARLLTENFIYAPKKELLDEALSTIQDPYSRHHVVQLKSLLKGTTAYDFLLPDVNGINHKMSDYRGKVVFMDFWYAACGPCQGYMKGVVGPVKEHFKNNPNVVFITVSTDSHQTFESMLAKVDFLPIGGIHLYTGNQYFKHPIIKHYNIKSYPYPLLIDKSGELFAMGNELRAIEELKNQIELALLK